MSGHANALLMLFLAFTGARLLGHLFQRFKLPVVVGELLAGAILGPQLLDLVHSSEVMDAMAELGVIMLLFMAGLETHIEELMETRAAAIKVAVLGAALPFVAGALVGLLFGWSSSSALFMATALTATSVGITVRALRELGHRSAAPCASSWPRPCSTTCSASSSSSSWPAPTSGSIDRLQPGAPHRGGDRLRGPVRVLRPPPRRPPARLAQGPQGLDPLRDRRRAHARALAARRLHRPGGDRRRLHRRPHHERAQAAHGHREAVRAAGLVLHAVLLRAHGHVPRLRRVRAAVGAAGDRRVHRARRRDQVPRRVARGARGRPRRSRARSASA